MHCFDCCLKPLGGESTSISVTLPQERYCVISGVVRDPDDNPVADLLVLLLSYETESLLAHTVTDSLGHFWFGPLMPDTLYRIRIQKTAADIRTVELQNRNGTVSSRMTRNETVPFSSADPPPA